MKASSLAKSRGWVARNRETFDRTEGAEHELLCAATPAIHDLQ